MYFFLSSKYIFFVSLVALLRFQCLDLHRIKVLEECSLLEYGLLYFTIAGTSNENFHPPCLHVLWHVPADCRPDYPPGNQPFFLSSVKEMLFVMILYSECKLNYV